MIGNITTGPGLICSPSGSGNSNYFSSVQSDTTNIPIGSLRHNPNSRSLEVFTGTAWIYYMQTNYNIDLDANTKSVIFWAQDKMAEEKKWKDLATENGTIKNLMNHIEETKEQIRTVAALCQ